jgi:hypothetical protein
VKALVQHTEDDDYWIVVQELYKDLYYMLQFHNFALWIESHRCTPSETFIEFPYRLQQLWNQTLISEGASMQSAVSQKIWKQSLVWAERRVGKTIYFQLAPDTLSSTTMDQLREFDLEDDKAWDTLKLGRAACGSGTVVLEYSVSKSNDLQFVYVMTKVCSQLPPFIFNVIVSIRFVNFKGGKFDFQKLNISDQKTFGFSSSEMKLTSPLFNKKVKILYRHGMVLTQPKIAIPGGQGLHANPPD